MSAQMLRQSPGENDTGRREGGEREGESVRGCTTRASAAHDFEQMLQFRLDIFRRFHGLEVDVAQRLGKLLPQPRRATRSVPSDTPSEAAIRSRSPALSP